MKLKIINKDTKAIMFQGDLKSKKDVAEACKRYSKEKYRWCAC